MFVGDRENKKNVLQYVKQLGIEDLVVFVGSCSNVQNYYSAAKIFVHDSPAEGFGLALVEAMHFGLPVVATDSPPGVREILGNDEYGLVCLVRDSEAMADHIYKLLSDETIYKQYVQKGYERIKDFTPEVISEQLEKPLKEI